MLSFFTDPYFIGFVIIGVFFSLLELAFSFRKEKKTLKEHLTDVSYQLINYKLVGPYFELLIVFIYSWIPFQSFNYGEEFWEGVPAWARFIIFLFAIDFCEYVVHNLLHRVPFLWEFHKVHHAIPKLDWWGNMHFHPIEIFVYKSCVYIPLLFLQPLFPPEYFLHLVLVRLFIGSMAHTNIPLSLGPLNYLINTPVLHRWHHAKGKEAINKNLGVTFTLWDFIFGTALYPKDRTYPEQGLGFPQSENYSNFHNQITLPFKSFLKGFKK